LIALPFNRSPGPIPPNWPGANRAVIAVATVSLKLEGAVGRRNPFARREATIAAAR
jgi:hypothetical protein